MEENQSKAKTLTENLPIEVMTTSTAESESLDSWTLVTDAKKPMTAVALESNENEPSGVEIVADESKNHENDDLSDGISIISECESAGRLSPLQSPIHDENDENHNQNNNNNQPLSYEPLTPPNTPDSWRDQSSQTTSRISRYAELISVSSSGIVDEQQGTDDDDDDKMPIPVNSVAPTTTITTKIGLFIRLPMSKLFILSTTIALIAFFGNLKYLGRHEQTTTNLPQLHERLESLELQNNLLRAEIDILSKSLNSMNRNQQPNRGGGGGGNSGEKFMKKHDKEKVWKNNNGRGNYRDYKEPIIQSSETVANEFDESNLPPSPPPPPPPQQQQAVPPQQHQQQVPPSPQPNGLPTYCKDGENLWCSQDPSKTENPSKAETTEDNLGRPEGVIGRDEKQVPDGLNEQIHSERREKYDKDYKKRQEKDSFKKDDYKKHFNNGKEHNDSKENHENRKFDKRRDDNYKKYDNSKEQYKNYNHKYENKKFDEKRDKKRVGGGDSKEKYDKKRQQYEKKKFNDSDYDDDDDDDDYDSHEHYSHHHDFQPQDSRERQRNDSKEYYEKRKNYQKYGKNQKHKKDNDYSDDDDHHHHQRQQHNQSDHDDWHEKMMQHRENIRTKKNYKNDNNWYLERGTGREEARIFEKKEKHDHHHKKYD